MMPIVWFYVALVAVLWSLLAYVEVQRRDREKVRGCLELEPISASKLWSLMIIDPQLVVVELQAEEARSPVLIHGAVRVPVTSLAGFLKSFSTGRSFAFYAPSAGSVSWAEVDTAVCGAGLKKGYVLDGEVELWRKTRLPIECPARQSRVAS